MCTLANMCCLNFKSFFWSILRFLFSSLFFTIKIIPENFYTFCFFSPRNYHLYLILCFGLTGANLTPSIPTDWNLGTSKRANPHCPTPCHLIFSSIFPCRAWDLLYATTFPPYVLFSPQNLLRWHPPRLERRRKQTDDILSVGCDPSITTTPISGVHFLNTPTGGRVIMKPDTDISFNFCQTMWLLEVDYNEVCTK